MSDAGASDGTTRTDNEDPPMTRRRTTMPDGRSLYYFTFGDETPRNEKESGREGAEDRDV